MADDITQEYLKECFEYNEASGVLTWKKRPKSHFKTVRSMRSHHTRFFSCRVGFEQWCGKKQYIRTHFNGKHHLIHRLIWTIVYGDMPKEVDHIDGNGLNNELSNLRNVTRSENGRNQRLRRNSKSGVTGVNWDKVNSKWKVNICVNGKRMTIGRFENKSDAIIARQIANLKYGFHSNHGNVQ